MKGNQLIQRCDWTCVLVGISVVSGLMVRRWCVGEQWALRLEGLMGPKD